MISANSSKLDQYARVALSSVDTLHASYHVCLSAILDQIPGDFVECGVFAGAQCGAMAQAILDSSESCERKLHLFDTFAGIPAPGPRDTEFLAAGHKEGLSRCDLASVRGNLGNRWNLPGRLFEFHQGMFQETLPFFASREPRPKIAVLRLDGDLYESTKPCLEYLYPLLSPGGWLIIDDYHLSGCRAACDEYLGGQLGPIYARKNR